ncbi:MAG TPA: hypothetical protein VL132_15905, partial [Planctomycetaceae bacterium]|nr:hypothetical protein [Planctomycetaceae bacterium]
MRSALSGLERAYLLIVNTPEQCVVGGERTQVDELIRRLGATFVPLATPSTVHCPVLRQVEPAYRELHRMRTTPPAGVRFYSTAWGRAYELNHESAAEAIVAQAVDTIDFPAVIRQAHADGVRQFMEIGPGASCTRMIEAILPETPVWSGAVCPATSDPLGVFLNVLGQLMVEGVPVDLSPLYGPRALKPSVTRTIRTPVGGAPYEAPPLPAVPTRRPVIALDSCATGCLPPVRSAVDDARADEPPVAHGAPLESKEAGNGPGVVPDIADLLGDDFVHSTAPIGDNSLSQLVSSMPAGVVEDLSVTAPVPQPLPSGLSAVAAPDRAAALQMLSELVSAQAAAHAAYLQVARQTFDLAAAELARQSTIVAAPPTTSSQNVGWVESSRPTTQAIDEGGPRGLDSPDIGAAANDVSAIPDTRYPIPAPPAWDSPQSPPRSLNREQCLEFAIGKIGRVLGETFAEIDAFPTRVRLPDEPLMLVDRILEIDGEPLSMTSGRVVTEHDIHPDAWYLDCGRIPTCIAVESGQADLFLSGWLGIDLHARGKAVYRLLDAVVTFHRELPGAGETIHYDIKINHFFRQGETYLFRFEFDATVNGEPLLTMREGCAGFFSEAELAGGKGVIHSTLDKRPQPGKLPPDWSEPCPLAPESFSDVQLAALRRGDLAACFGPRFRNLPLHHPVTLPDGRMRLVDRVLSIEPGAGKYGLGVIRAEMDIHSDDWFLTCHFCDDQVMPGTLMYECCLHTLRIYLLRLGWIGEAGQIAYEPIPGIRSRLKCRGQVVASTQKVWYEVTIKELGRS